MPKGIQITKNTEEYILNIPMIQSMGFGSATLNDVIFSGLTTEQYENIKSAVESYVPSGGGGGGSYDEGYADGEAAKESAIASSQAVTANLYKSKLASEDADIAAADSTDIDGQGTIFSESYSYLKTSAEMQANYDEGYDEGYDDGVAAATGIPFTKDDFVSEWQYFDSDCFWQHKGVSYYTMTSGNNRGQYEADSTYVWRIHQWNQKISAYRIWHGPSGNAYYSEGSTQYVLNEQNMEWTTISWSGFSSFNGEYIWHDSLGNVYFSKGSDQYVLDEQNMTWTSVNWNGFSTPSGYYIWNGPSGKAYYSNGSDQYALDEQNMAWVAVTWAGVPSFYGIDTFTDSLGIVRLLRTGYGPTYVYILDESTYTFSYDNWTFPQSYSGGGQSIFMVGTTLLYHRTGYIGNYIVDTVNKTFTDFKFYTYTLTPPNAIYSNGTVYEFSDIDMSYKPKSNNP